MRHPLDRSIATGFEQQVFQKRRDQGDLTTPILNPRLDDHALIALRIRERDDEGQAELEETPIPFPYMSGKGRGK